MDADAATACPLQKKEEAPAPAEEKKPEPASATLEKPTPAPPGPSPAAAAPPPPPPAQKRADGRVIATPYAKKLAKELGVDLGTLAGSGPAGRITASDVEAVRGNGKGRAPPCKRTLGLPVMPKAYFSTHVLFIDYCKGRGGAGCQSVALSCPAPCWHPPRCRRLMIEAGLAALGDYSTFCGFDYVWNSIMSF